MMRLFVNAHQASLGRPSVRRASLLSGVMKVEESVQDALAYGNPVVALESTIVAHGMPFPQNLELAKEVENILRGKGVVPATIAIRDGLARIGLTEEELEDLAKAGEEGRAKKCSTRDLPGILSSRSKTSFQSHWGATTVASTMKLAHLAGISTFVTGGIGGVHRGGHKTMDISADLMQLSQTPVVVVSAGIKSILDIEKTLEVLETNGVPTFGWQTDEFPAFFSPRSGVQCPSRVDSADDVAASYWVARALDLPQGMLVAVPNSDPVGENVEKAIKSSLRDAEEQNIHGQALTPFILKSVALKTGGDSLRSNMALVRQNALVGASIAIAIASVGNASRKESAEGDVLPSGINQSPFVSSGLSRNLGILKECRDLRMSPMSPDNPVLDEILKYADILVLDGGKNIKEQQKAAKQAVKDGADVVFIPSGVPSAISASGELQFLSCVKYAVLDVDELLAISDGWTDSQEDIEFALYEADHRTLKRAATRTMECMNDDGAYIVIFLGEKGLMLASKDGKNEITFQHYPHMDGIDLYKGTAASDCLSGAFLHELLDGRSATEATVEGLNSVISLLSEGRVTHPFLSQYGAAS